MRQKKLNITSDRKKWKQQECIKNTSMRIKIEPDLSVITINKWIKWSYQKTKTPISETMKEKGEQI